MSEPKPLASLTSRLLARKGGARPAMRPQMDWAEQNRLVFGDAYADPVEDDLGWNDMGDAPVETLPALSPVVVLAPEVPVAATPVPEVLRQIESLANVITRKAATRARAEQAELATRGDAHDAPRASMVRERKLAFTLRLDAERHLRLRMACTLRNRSAQMLMVDALDRLLESIPELEDLARHARRG